jgi:5-methylcytosine-specific restriction enzyme A
MNVPAMKLRRLAPLNRGRELAIRRRQGAALLKVSHKVVKKRDGNRCVLCGRHATEVHHRRPRQMGGSRLAYLNMPGNLICLCSDHHRHIEANRTWAYAEGLLVPSFGAKPSDRPVHLADGWWLLDDEGQRRPCAIPDWKKELDL